MGILTCGVTEVQAQTINNLAPGTYSVVVTDSEGCYTNCSITIHPSSNPTCHINGTDTKCGLNNGSAVVTGSGGVAPYTYLWSTGSTASSVSGLAAGTYSVTITDAEGCYSDCHVTIGDSSSPVCSATWTDTTCGEANGTASVIATGGTPGYFYAWSNGQSTQTITGLAEGTYNVTVTDMAGCTSSCTVYVGTSDTPSCTVTGTNTTCGEANGTANSQCIWWSSTVFICLE